MRAPVSWMLAPMVALMSAGFSPPARSQEAVAVSVDELRRIGLSLTFLKTPPSGRRDLAVVYDPTHPPSLREAEHVAALMGTGLDVGASGRPLTLAPRLVPVAALAQVTDVAALYVTDRVFPHYDAVFDAARRLRVPSVTARDFDCVVGGWCVLGVEDTPDDLDPVTVLLNHRAAVATGANFSLTYRFLADEL